jgi:hypothetical protein
MPLSTPASWIRSVHYKSHWKTLNKTQLRITYTSKYFPNTVRIRGVADNSVTRTGRKMCTANKLGICSTYSQRSSGHFLALFSNFWKPIKKDQKFFISNYSPRHDRTVHRTKNGELSIAPSVQGTGGSPTGPDRKNRVGDQNTRSPSTPVSFGLHVPGEPGHWHVRSKPPWGTSRWDFPSNAPADMSNTPRW